MAIVKEKLARKLERTSKDLAELKAQEKEIKRNESRGRDVKTVQFRLTRQQRDDAEALPEVKSEKTTINELARDQFVRWLERRTKG